MGNDMTWEQKCRISALRAACASPLDFQFTAVKDSEGSEMSTDHLALGVGETDEHMTQRILARAEAFRIALLSDGALDVQYDNVEASQDKSTIEGTVANCTRCLRAIRWLEPPGSEGRWIDAGGISQCHNNDRSYGDHTIEVIQEVCPRCGSSRKDTPLMIGPGVGCEHQWHQE